MNNSSIDCIEQVTGQVFDRATEQTSVFDPSLIPLDIWTCVSRAIKYEDVDALLALALSCKKLVYLVEEFMRNHAIITPTGPINVAQHNPCRFHGHVTVSPDPYYSRYSSMNFQTNIQAVFRYGQQVEKIYTLFEEIVHFRKNYHTGCRKQTTDDRIPNIQFRYEKGNTNICIVKYECCECVVSQKVGAKYIHTSLEYRYGFIFKNNVFIKGMKYDLPSEREIELSYDEPDLAYQSAKRIVLDKLKNPTELLINYMRSSRGKEPKVKRNNTGTNNVRSNNVNFDDMEYLITQGLMKWDLMS